MVRNFNPRAAVSNAVGTLTHGPDIVRGKYRMPSGPLNPFCPHCEAPECHPTTPDRVLVRGFKHTDAKGHHWSQCLVCASAAGAGGYDDSLDWQGPLNEDQRSQGWF